MMSAEELGILFAGISSILATLIYFTKNIKKSKCCNTTCEQVVLDGHGEVVNSFSRTPEIDIEMATFPQQRVAVI